MDFRPDDPLYSFSLGFKSTRYCGRLDKYPELTYVPSLRSNGLDQLDENLDSWAATGVGGIPEGDALFEMDYCSLADGLLRGCHFYGTEAYVVVHDVGADLASIGFVVER